MPENKKTELFQKNKDKKFLKKDEPEKESAAENTTHERDSELTIVKLTGSKIRVLLPDGYIKCQNYGSFKGFFKSVTNNDAYYQKNTPSSENFILVKKLSPNQALPVDDIQRIIDRNHELFKANEGFIDVKHGVTVNGYRYVCPVVKIMMSDNFGVVRYFLRLDLFRDNEIIEVMGQFTETGTTGAREAACMQMAKKAGLVEIGKKGLTGWAEDPFDPSYVRGCRKNLSEKEGLDGLFPDSPLSQARELLLAVIENKFVETKPHTDGKTEDSNETDEQEYIKSLFTDECRRHTYTVDIDQKITPKKSRTSSSDKKDNPVTEPEIRVLSAQSALKLIYYMMAADGEIFHNEEGKFNSVGSELDPDFAKHKEEVVTECKANMDKVIDPEDYYEVLKEGVSDAIAASDPGWTSYITPKLLVWELLTIAYSDENYDETERKLMKYIVRKLNVDKTVFLEMESSIQTIMALEKELEWIKTTDRPYLEVEKMVNEIEDRKNVIFESVKNLIKP